MHVYHHISFVFWLFALLIICYGAFIKLWCPSLLSFIYPDSTAFWVIVGVVLDLVLPVLLELVYNLIAYLRLNAYMQHHSHEQYCGKSGIVYSAAYNITFCGLEKCHPFDSQKYGRCFGFLQAFGVLTQNTKVHSPDVCPRALLLPLNKLYLLSHSYTLFICAYLEICLIFIPGWLFRYRVLNPMLCATMGSIEGCCIALEKGWAINLSGGYHHARRTFGGGFCIYPDIYLAITHMRSWHPHIRKVMIIDLDAHQGNGHERDFMEDSDVYTLDVYNHNIYPFDVEAKRKINRDVAVDSHDDTAVYLHKVRRGLESAFQDFSEVQFILYNAGTDILEGDPLGHLHVTEDGVVQRDEMVFQAAFDHQVPILMVLSGGYQAVNALVIAKSLQNLFHKFPQMAEGSGSTTEATLLFVPFTNNISR